MDCKYCKTSCLKAGFQKNGIQKYYCKACKKYQQAIYSSHAYHPESNRHIGCLLRESIGLRGVARILRISLSTVISRIKRISEVIEKPVYYSRNRVFEIDEMWSYVGSKENEIWLMYILDRHTKQVIDFRVGSRTKENLQALTDQLIPLSPSKICTDGLNTYRSIVPARLHYVGLVNTRHIERHNLSIRTHLKRLSRKTICFSRSVEMLRACLKIYFWGGQVSGLVPSVNVQ